MAKCTQHLILVGGGHSHIQVIKNLSKQNTICFLVSDSDSAVYSGMLPAAVAGLCSEDDSLVYLRPLCKKFGWHFIRGSVVSANSSTRDIRINIAARNQPQLLYTLKYDALSINVGSRTRSIPSSPSLGTTPKGAFNPMVIKTRPIGELMAAVQRFEDAVLSLPKAAVRKKVVVLGGGAAGLELALALDTRLRQCMGEIDVKIISKTDPMASHFGRAVSNAIRAELRKRKAQIITGKYAVALNEKTGTLLLEDNSTMQFDLLVMATGAAAHEWLGKNTDLVVDENGWLVVEPNLLCKGKSDVFATGDCASFGDRYGESFPPKAGVYAVRMGPILTHNLEAVLMSTGDDSPPLKDYIPQSTFLSLISTGDGRGIGSKYGLAFKGTWVYRLKNYIDDGWQQQFRVEQSADQDSSAWKDEHELFTGTPSQGAAILLAADDVLTGDTFHLQLMVLRRMDVDEQFRIKLIECADTSA